MATGSIDSIESVRLPDDRARTFTVSVRPRAQPRGRHLPRTRGCVVRPYASAFPDIGHTASHPVRSSPVAAVNGETRRISNHPAIGGSWHFDAQEDLTAEDGRGHHIADEGGVSSMRRLLTAVCGILSWRHPRRHRTTNL